DEAAVDLDLVVDVRAGRKAGGADIADHLALADALSDLDALRIRGHVAVGGLIAVRMLDADVLAVTAFPAGEIDRAVAGGEDRRAVAGRPVDAGVHAREAEDRMPARAEARSHHRVVDRLADQELLRALAGLVVVVDDRVIRRLESIVFLGFA